MKLTRFVWVNILAIVLLILSLGLSGFTPSVAVAGYTPFSCGTTGSPGSGTPLNNCYAVEGWSQYSWGAATYLSIANLYANDNNGADPEIRVANSIWIKDTANSADPNYCSNVNIAGYCYIQVGEEAYNADQVDYFFADRRPKDNNTPSGSYTSHFLSGVQNQDWSNNGVLKITIYPCGTYTYCITTDISVSGYIDRVGHYQSTDNPIFPNATLIGEELSGSAGSAIGPFTVFNQNQYYDRNSFTQQYETDAGVLNPPYQNHPPNAGWTNNPFNGGGNTGGTFAVECSSFADGSGVCGF